MRVQYSYNFNIFAKIKGEGLNDTIYLGLKYYLTFSKLTLRYSTFRNLIYEYRESAC